MHLAHVKENEDQTWEEHDLVEHLESVGRLASEFASEFNSADWARVAGLWHDLGKFNPKWQEYLKGKSGFDPEAHIEGKGKIDHSSAGAQHAIGRHKEIGKIFAYLLAGHHAGLPDWHPDDGGGDLSRRVMDQNGFRRDHLDIALSGEPSADLLEIPFPNTESLKDFAKDFHLWIRMLFSSLVDADFLNTEKFMEPTRAEKRSNSPSLAEIKKRFDKHMNLLKKDAPDTFLNRCREVILGDCSSNAELKPGFFTLSVPTGGGKTLSGMAFALNHALKYKKRRIVWAIPYTSIIEQTAEVYRKALGSDAVLEHHSNIDPESASEENTRSRLASENWDAPIVVTTNVQLFESLFSSRTSRCRKLHNLVGSVILLDEAQMLPPEFLKPILSVLRGLVNHFGCTVVFCTATQPSLVGSIGSGKSEFTGISLDCVRELMTTKMPKELAQDLKRVQVEFPEGSEEPVEWSQLAEELLCHDQVLCIVNTRQDARDLFTELLNKTDEGLIHLSNNMCGAHKSECISEMRKKLRSGESIRVVSTQLIEAGVDVDFPVVYRALAGLDSVAQAAGRCNREGRLNSGIVRIFIPPKPPPKGMLTWSRDACLEELRTNREKASNLDPEALTGYFRKYFSRHHDFDKADAIGGLMKTGARCNLAKLEFQFRSVAKKFHLIDEKGQQPVIVFYSSEKYNGEKWISLLQCKGPERWLLRKLQRFIVNIPTYVFDELRKNASIVEVVDSSQKPTGIWIQHDKGLYHQQLGLLGGDVQWNN